MRHLSLFLLLIITINAYCQNNARYEVFKSLGHVSNASTGKELKKGDSVRLLDKLIIGKDSKAGILDRQQHRIYYSLNSGTHSVASILRDAKRRADNAVAAVNSEVLNQSKQMSKRPNVTGVSFRGSGAEDAFLQSVCNAVLDIPNATPDSCLNLETVKDDDGAYYFSMVNDTDSLLYVNVITVSPEGTPQLCLNVGNTQDQPYISVAPKSQLTLSEFVFVDSEPTDYYMFASFEPVDSQALSLLLKVGMHFDEVENASIIVAPKITVQPDE